MNKSALPVSAGPGDLVTFTSVLSNTGNSAAFAPSWSDVLPATMTNPQLLSVKHSGLPTLTAGTDYASTTVGNTLSVASTSRAAPTSPPASR